MGKLAQRLHLGVHGEVRIVLERTSFQPGDEVVGVVHLHVDKTIAHAQLHVSVHGEQRLRWNERRGEAATPHSATVKHLNLTSILTPADSTFEPGERQYPFAFTLPTAGLLPNFTYARGRVSTLERVRFNLEYAVGATLVVDSHTTANLSALLPFTLEEPTNHSVAEPTRCATVQQDRVVKLLHLIPSGSCNMRMHLASDIFSADSTIEAQVTLEISNTTRRLKYAKLVLFEDATVDRRRGGNLKHSSRIVGSRRFEAATLGVSDQRLERTLLLPITPNDIYKFDTLLPTLDTQFLKLNYRVALECHFAAASTARVSVPVLIVTKRPAYDHREDV